jgi:hypothetical protein
MARDVLQEIDDLFGGADVTGFDTVDEIFVLLESGFATCISASTIIC